jgi:Chlamydia polymorphic membrane protein (Chlamydia_PMP) repeat
MTSQNRLRSRLRLEPLEERAIPAMFNIANGDVVALLAAVNTANSSGEEEIINLATGGTYSLSESLAFHGNPLTTINGSGATLTRNSAGPAFGIITVDSGGLLFVDRVTITNGLAGDGGGLSVGESGRVAVVNSTITGNSATNSGGGACVLPGGSLTLADSTISGNSADNNGGGICVSPQGSALVGNSTISGNFANNGGGIYVAAFPSLALTVGNSTISGNSADNSGGGIWMDGPATAVIQSSTIAFNIADSDNVGAGDGGGIFVFIGGSMTLQSTLVANNLHGLTGSSADIAGSVTASNCLVEDIFGTVFAAGSGGNIIGQDPHLGALADNGGPTLTHALLAGSPATEAGGSVAGLVTDQRGPGFARVVGLAADIGAFEDQAPPPPPPPPPISPEPTPQALQAAAQIVQTLQRGGAKLAAFAFGEANGDTAKDIVVAFRQRNGKLLVATLSGANGGVVGAFQPFSQPLATGARVQLLLLNLNADPLLDIGLSINGGGTGIPRVSAFTVAGARLL